MRFDRRDILRATALRWTTPLRTPRMSSVCIALKASAAAALSPVAIAVSDYFTLDLMRERRASFTALRFSDWRAAFAADFVLAIAIFRE